MNSRLRSRNANVLLATAVAALLSLSFSGDASAYEGASNSPASQCGSCFTTGGGGGSGGGIADYWELSNVSNRVDWRGIDTSHTTPAHSDLSTILNNSSGSRHRCDESAYAHNCLKWRDEAKSDSSWDWDVHTADPWGLTGTPTGGTNMVVGWNIKIFRLKYSANENTNGLPSDATPIFERRVGINVAAGCGKANSNGACDTDKDPIYNKQWWMGGRGNTPFSASADRSGGPLFQTGSKSDVTRNQCRSNFEALGADHNNNRNTAGNVVRGNQRPVKTPGGSYVPISRNSIGEGDCYWEGTQIGSASTNTQFGPGNASGKGLREAIRIRWSLPKRGGAPWIKYYITGVPKAWYLVQLNGITNREKLIPMAADTITGDDSGVSSPSSGFAQNYFKLFVANPGGCADPSACEPPRTQGRQPDVSIQLDSDSPLQSGQTGKSQIQFIDNGGFTDDQAFFPKLVRLQHFTPQMDYNGAKNPGDSVNSYSKKFVKYDTDLGASLRSIPDPRPGPPTGASTSVYYCAITHRVYETSATAAANTGCSNSGPGNSRVRTVPRSLAAGSASTTGAFALCPTGDIYIASSTSAITPTTASGFGRPGTCTTSTRYQLTGLTQSSGTGTSRYLFLNFARLPQSPKLDREQSLAGVLAQNNWFTTWLHPTLTNPCYPTSSTPSSVEVQAPDRDATKAWPRYQSQCNTQNLGNQSVEPGATRNAWDDYFSARANWEKRWIATKGETRDPKYLTNQSLRCDSKNSTPHGTDSGCTDHWQQLQNFGVQGLKHYAQGYLLTGNTDGSGYSNARVVLGKNFAANRVQSFALWNRANGNIMGWSPSATKDAESSNTGIATNRNNPVTEATELNFCKQGIPQNANVPTRSQVNAAGDNDGNSSDSTYTISGEPDSAGSPNCQGPTVKWNWDNSQCKKGPAPSDSGVAGSLIYSGLRSNLPNDTQAMIDSYGRYGSENGNESFSNPGDWPDKNRAYRFGTSWLKDGANWRPLYDGKRPGTTNNKYGPCDVVENGFLEVRWNYHYTFVRTGTTGWTPTQINNVNNRANSLERQNKPLLATAASGIKAGTTSTVCSAGDPSCRFGYWYLDRLDWEYAGCRTDGTYPNLLGGVPPEATGVYSDTTGKYTYRFGPPSASSSISWGAPSNAHVSDSYATQTVESPSTHNPRDPRTGYVRCSVSTPGYTLAGSWGLSREPGAGWGKNNTGPRIPANTGYTISATLGGFTAGDYGFGIDDCVSGNVNNAPTGCTLPAWSMKADHDANSSWVWNSAWQNSKQTNGGQDTVENSASVRVYSPRDTR